MENTSRHRRHIIFNADPYNSIHEAHLIEARHRSLTEISPSKAKKTSNRARMTSLNVNAAKAAYEKAISTAFAR